MSEYNKLLKEIKELRNRLARREQREQQELNKKNKTPAIKRDMDTARTRQQKDQERFMVQTGRMKPPARNLPTDYKKSEAKAREAAAAWEKKKKQQQGYNSRLDESLAARDGAESTKQQSLKDRRDESRGAEKADNRPAYSGNSSSNQGKKDSNLSPMEQWAKANPKLAAKVKKGEAGYDEISKLADKGDKLAEKLRKGRSYGSKDEGSRDFEISYDDYSMPSNSSDKKKQRKRSDSIKGVSYDDYRLKRGRK